MKIVIALSRATVDTRQELEAFEMGWAFSTGTGSGFGGGYNFDEIKGLLRLALWGS